MPRESALKSERAVIIGAGIGGLTAAIDLARQGLAVDVVESADAPGGKMRMVRAGDVFLDAGPTVFTMREVFDALFADAGATLDDYVTLEPLHILARHAWSAEQQLDLFPDLARSVEAVGDFAGAEEARGFVAFSARAKEMFDTLERSFMRAQRPTPMGLVNTIGLANVLRISPFTTFWSELGKYFRDGRLRQMFGRYATYCGSSPFAAPATLMLVSHAERRGVWSVEGGMHRLALGLAELASQLGVHFRFGNKVAEILVRGSKAHGVRLASGAFLPTDVIVCNADVSALAQGLFGERAASAASAVTPAHRTLSAVTWLMNAASDGFPLLRHNVFFSRDYAAEFDDLFVRSLLPGDPTVYVCAQDRADGAPARTGSPERLLCLVNAPATGDRHDFGISEIEQCRDRAMRQMKRCGLTLRVAPAELTTVTPSGFNCLFPATGGALYGRATHGPIASFRRPGSRTRIEGLYLAGGSVHPGAGVPMAALSGRLAAQAVMADLGSTRRSYPTVTPGGISTPSATTAVTD